MKINDLIKIILMMNIGELLSQCDIEPREIFRKFERFHNKIIDSKWSKNLNETCLNENGQLLQIYSSK